MLYVAIYIDKKDKNYEILRELDFTDAKSIVLPVGPKEKLFSPNEKSFMKIIISTMPIKLAILA